MNYRKLLSFKGMSSPDNKNPTTLGEFNVPINVQEKAPKKCFKPKTTTQKVEDIHQLYTEKDLAKLYAKYGNMSKCYTSCVEPGGSRLQESEVSFNSCESAFYLMDENQ